MMAPRRVAVTGLGAVSGFGAGAERLWAALVEGRRAVAHRPALAEAGLPSTVALVPGGDPLAPGDRAVPLALAAAAEAVADAGGVDGGERLAVFLGTTLGAIADWLPMVCRGVAPTGAWTWSAPAQAVAAAHGARGAVSTVALACASANGALGSALDEVRSGRADVALAGGVDALTDFVLAGFGVLKATDPGPCRPFDRERRGLNLGEGACILVLESEDRARARGAVVRAFLDGYGAAADAHHMTGPDPEGRGAARAMAAALADGALPVEELAFVSAHGTGTAFNDRMEARALAALLGRRAPSVPVHSIKGALGHALGAAGALEALACVRALETGTIPPTVGCEQRDPEVDLDVVAGAARPFALRSALSTSSGFGGLNAAILLRAAA
jgi:3-oxoacyl-[acyl-carrier-protein] synthase II